MAKKKAERKVSIKPDINQVFAQLLEQNGKVFELKCKLDAAEHKVAVCTAIANGASSEAIRLFLKGPNSGQYTITAHMSPMKMAADGKTGTAQAWVAVPEAVTEPEVRVYRHTHAVPKN